MVRKRVIGLLFLPLAVLLLQGSASAELLSGSVEWFTQNGDSKTTDVSGLTTDVKTRTFLQRYMVNVNIQPTPKLFLQGGVWVEDQTANSESNASSTKLERTLLMPAVTLRLADPFVNAGVGYDRRDEMLESGGLVTRMYRDSSHAHLGLRPEGLPTLDLQYVATSRYDRDHKTLDLDEDVFQLSSMYRPVKSVQINYAASLSDQQDHLTASDTKSLTQTARVGYVDRFFDDRWLLAAHYYLTAQDIDSRRGTTVGGGVRVQLFPVVGLSSINDAPQLGALTPNPALINGDLLTSSGVNIGQALSLGGDVQRRNVGVDFGIQTAVSTLYVWVDRPLPAVVANSFLWDVYTSPDNLNWFLAQTVFPANFGQFDNRFEISFSAVSARYVKVVTRPLSVAVPPPPGFDVSNIFITEVQAFLDQTVFVQAPGTTVHTSQNSNNADVNSRIDIIRSERHSLFYDFYYRSDRFEVNDRSPQTDSMMTNALIASERFSRVFSGSAKVMRQQDEVARMRTETYTDTEASLLAAWNSLRKLGHTLAVTAKRENWEKRDTTRDTGTASLTNTAEVYPGVNAYLGAIKNLTSTETGTATGRGDETQLTAGADIVPHPSLTLNVSYAWSASDQTVVGATTAALGSANRRTQNSFASAAYNPFSALYLYGTVQRTEETGKPTVTYTTFSGSWSSQITGGALELRLIYSENANTQGDTRTRTYGPYARYRMNIRASLEMVYLISMTESPVDRVDSRTLNTTFKMFF